VVHALKLRFRGAPTLTNPTTKQSTKRSTRAKRLTPPIHLGLGVRASIVRVKDGDTCRVRISRELDIRLLDCWAPETKGEERPAGEVAAAYLQSLLPEGSEVYLQIDGDDRDVPVQDFGQAITMQRVLGRMYLPDGRDVSAEMVKAGKATKAKAPKAKPKKRR